ncbi:MAG: biotin/lipoyl-containing protein [Vicinamibacteria bacterium]
MIVDATVAGRTARVEVTGGEGGRYRVTVDGRALTVDQSRVGAHERSLLVDGRSHDVSLSLQDDRCTVVLEGRAFEVLLGDAAVGDAGVVRARATGPVRLLAPMPGKLVRLLVAADQEVAAGQGLLVMEAMKMENELKAPRAGRVREIHVAERQAVETGALLLVLE